MTQKDTKSLLDDIRNIKPSADKVKDLDDLGTYLRGLCNAIGANYSEKITPKSFYGLSLQDLMDEGVLTPFNPSNSKGQILRTTDGEVLYTWLPGEENKIHMYWCGVITKDKKGMLTRPMNSTTDARNGYFYVGTADNKNNRIFTGFYKKLPVCEKCFEYIKSNKYGTTRDFNFMRFSLDNMIDRSEFEKYASFDSDNNPGWKCCECFKSFDDIENVVIDKEQDTVWCKDCYEKFGHLCNAQTTEDIDNWWKEQGHTNPRTSEGANAVIALIKNNNSDNKFELAKYMINRYDFSVTEESDNGKKNILTYLGESISKKDNIDDVKNFIDFVIKKGVKIGAYYRDKEKQNQFPFCQPLLNNGKKTELSEYVWELLGNAGITVQNKK